MAIETCLETAAGNSVNRMESIQTKPGCKAWPRINSVINVWHVVTLGLGNESRTEKESKLLKLFKLHFILYVCISIHIYRYNLYMICTCIWHVWFAIFWAKVTGFMSCYSTYTVDITDWHPVFREYDFVSKKLF